jgi:hypothetical protein
MPPLNGTNVHSFLDVLTQKSKIVDDDDEICDVKSSKFAFRKHLFYFTLTSIEGVLTLSHLANLSILCAEERNN